jgi:hypothetical protein
MSKLNTTKKILLTIITFFIFIILVSCSAKASSLKISGSYKQEYFLNESFDKTGLNVYVVYSNDKQEEITNYEVIGFDSSKVGKNEVKISYEKLEAFISLTIKEKNIISLNVTGSYKTSYLVNEPLDATGLNVEVVYEDNSIEILSSSAYTLSGFDSSTTGTKTVTVSYKNHTTTFTVLVVAIGLNVSGDYKKLYYLGETFDNTGIIVKLVNTTLDTEEEINQGDYQVLNFNSQTVGIINVTIKYLEYQTNISLVIADQNAEIETIAQTKLKVYDFPSILESSNKVSVSVEDKSLHVFETLANNNRVFSWATVSTTASVASFDFEGRVKVEVTVKGTTIVTSAKVTPLSYGITPLISGNKITFYLEQPANYTIEYNDPVPQIASKSETQEALHLFANPIETDPITAQMAENDPNIIFIAPGVWKTDTISLSSGKTVYISGGALLYGQFNAYNLSNITIRGRGFISGSIYTRRVASEKAIPMEFQKCSNIKIEGISILDPAGWVIFLQQSEDITIDNVKIITARANGDGISVQSCKNVLVTNCFVRSWDDSLVVKNTANASTENITFRDCVIWTDLAQSMEVGYECYGASMQNILFENITVLHSYHKAAMSIHNADQAEISGVTFKDITIEKAFEIGDNWQSDDDNFIIDMTIAFNPDWTKSGTVRGYIRNVTFENVKVLEQVGNVHIRMSGFDTVHNIDGVVFKDVNFNNSVLTSSQAINSNNFVSNISIQSSLVPNGASKHVYYDLMLVTSDVLKYVTTANDQAGVLVPEFSVSQSEPPYAGTKINSPMTVIATYGTSNTSWGQEQYINNESFDLDGNPISNILINNSNLWQSDNYPVPNQSGEFIALTIYFNGLKIKVGSIRLYGLENSYLFQLQNIGIYASTSLNTSTGLPNWSKKTNGEDIEFSPAKGNYADINISPQDFYAIQIRFYHKNGILYPSNAFIKYLELYPASLAFGKTPYASAYEDVYNPEKLTDGDLNTYFESEKGTFPGWIIVDLGEVYPVKIINLHLPPLSSWPDRTQRIEIKYSTSLLTNSAQSGWIVLFETTDYLFTGTHGNMISLTLSDSVDLRCIILIVYANSSPSGEAAQFSEISIYS